MPTIQEGQSAKIIEINKQILEIKKKIQLSEGQRKAIFEECEAERKSNAEEISKVKKEISQLVVSLHENKSANAKLKIQTKRIENLIGPIADKSSNQVQELLDLQIIDRNKHLDVIRYRIKKRGLDLQELAKEYQVLLSEKAKKQVAEKVDVPIKKSTCELQNNIHAVEVQLREAIHISNRYADIKKSLQDDSARFESKVRNLDEKLTAQKADVNRLQKVLEEATHMRSVARSILLQEERAALASGTSREHQAAEGRRILTERKRELEKLERRIFQGGKSPGAAMRQEPEGAEDDANITDNEKQDTPPPQHPLDALQEVFDSLKQATGGTTSEEVLQRFVSQKETHQRLMMLRKNSENEKHKLEQKLDKMNALLEQYKYAEAKDAERQSEDMEIIKKKIENENERAGKFANMKTNKEESVCSVLGELQKLYVSIDPLALPERDSLILLEKIKTSLRAILLQTAENDQEEGELEEKVICVEVNDEKWLPTPYNTLIRRTPLPQAGTPAPPPATGSDEEEEVPSRGFLKRQAQLVVDAKSRKKTVRIPRK